MNRFLIYTTIILFGFIYAQHSSLVNNNKINQLSNAIGITPESNLFNNESFNLLLVKFDSLGIKDEQLKDGFDWGGGEAGFEAYINNNIDTLLSIFVIVEEIIIDKNEAIKQSDSLMVNDEVNVLETIQAVNNLSIKKPNVDKNTNEDKIRQSESKKSLLSGLRIGGGLGKVLIKGSSLSSSTSYVESSFNIRFPFGIKIGPFLTSLGYESSNYSFSSSIDTLDSYYGSGSGVLINFDLSKILKIGGEKLVKEFVIGSQNYNHGTGLMAGYNINLLLGSLPFSISVSSRFNTMNFNMGGTSYWVSFYLGMGIDFL
jgi:hypothetical protein